MRPEVLIIAVTLVLGAVFAVGLVMAMRPRLGSKRYLNLDALAADVAAVTGLTDETERWHPDLSLLRFSGELERRATRVSFFTESIGDATFDCVRLAVKADETPHLVVREETILTKIRKLLGDNDEFEVGDEEFDRRFLLETHSPQPASRMLRGPVRKSIWRIFDHGARDLRFENGEIVVTARTRAIEPASYAKILASLRRIAATLDRKSIPVHVLGGERRALMDEKGDTRCPYCLANIAGDEPDLVACDKCKAVVHAGCWEEHGGCPILGCTGKVERARTR